MKEGKAIYFSNPDRDTTTKHYFAKDELDDGAAIRDSFDPSKGFPESLKAHNLPPENVDNAHVKK